MSRANNRLSLITWKEEPMMSRAVTRVSNVLVAAVVIVLTGLPAGCRREPAPKPAQTPPAAEAARPAAPAAKPVPQPPKPLEQFVSQRIVFQPPVFYGTTFPACDFDNVPRVKTLIGPYTVTATFYDARGEKVETAEKPGRYAAVVEIKRGEGRVSRRFVTLCRLAGEGRPEGHTDVMDPVVLKAGGVDEQVLADFATETDRPRFRPNAPTAMREMMGAMLAASLMDRTQLKAEGKPVPKDSVMQLDRQWWVDFKRRFYGLDKVYPNAFVCPRPIEGKSAPVVHEGTLAQAGMKSDADRAIDGACEAWATQERVGFSLCVVRHGVIVVNKAYGKQAGNYDAAHKDDPYTVDTAAPMASMAKFLGGLLLLEFADQGLVDPDAPVDKYVPALAGIEVKKPMTVRDCYLHIAGFNCNVGDMNNDLEELVADVYPVMEVGVTHRYHGGGLALGGKVMEMMSGECFPRLIRKCLLDPLGCAHIETPGTSGGGGATAIDLAKIGQMTLSGGAYGDVRFFRPETLAKAMPIAGHDRWDPPDKTCRWGIGIKQFDIDGLSDRAFGHPGASGTCLVVDPTYDLVIAMTRFEEGGSFKAFLKKKSVIYKAVLDSMEDQTAPK
jgi:CubicO group peptidase (beta-lactamase class C family)